MNPIIINPDEIETTIDSIANIPNNNDYTSNIKNAINANAIEEFNNINNINNITKQDYKELKLINKNLYNKDFICVEPIEMSYLFIYIIVIIILVFILVKYFTIKNKLINK